MLIILIQLYHLMLTIILILTTAFQEVLEKYLHA